MSGKHTRPTGFTPAMDKKRRKLARKLEKVEEIESPWGVATWLVRREKLRRRKKKR